ncbi:HAD family hydrolase [Leptolyngbya sp. FACHB-36]|uniref:HAD-IA family hydrolase n=1 Tax=Leptolyngbya sp. FACHB-36 TaxID=2692808 RepID=UPI001680EC58|nr:HAD family hydrolase [Leptolyngbya sp. FACHB-36]MBD2022713.1 HAD family hydrolase [Leptolyngbya sp. FACHB-36]
MKQPPTVIFLDAVGTLFGIRGSVGQVYGDTAKQFGVTVSAEALDQAFLQNFRNAGAPAFLEPNPTELQAKEFAWWLAIATQTFQQAGVLDQFSDFTKFFAELYNRFATAAPWEVYPDVVPSLERWQQQGVQLGILSNFDSRLYPVLHALDLAHFFSSVTISTESGAAKPDRKIFEIALQKHQCTPEQAWHIGDRYDEDYQAARSAGLRGIWLRRDKE